MGFFFAITIYYYGKEHDQSSGQGFTRQYSYTKRKKRINYTSSCCRFLVICQPKKYDIMAKLQMKKKLALFERKCRL